MWLRHQYLIFEVPIGLYELFDIRSWNIFGYTRIWTKRNIIFENSKTTLFTRVPYITISFRYWTANEFELLISTCVCRECIGASGPQRMLFRRMRGGWRCGGGDRWGWGWGLKGSGERKRRRRRRRTPFSSSSTSSVAVAAGPAKLLRRWPPRENGFGLAVSLLVRHVLVYGSGRLQNRVDRVWSISVQWNLH